MRNIKLLHFFLVSCFRYYYDNRDVKEDKEFGNFLNELSIDGKPLFHGRIGKVSLLSNFSSVVSSLTLLLPNATNLAEMALHFKLIQSSLRMSIVWKFFMDLVTKLNGNFLIALLFWATGSRPIKSQKSKTNLAAYNLFTGPFITLNGQPYKWIILYINRLKVYRQRSILKKNSVILYLGSSHNWAFNTPQSTTRYQTMLSTLLTYQRSCTMTPDWRRGNSRFCDCQTGIHLL